MSKILTVKDAASILNVAVITLRRLIKKRKIPFHRIGSRFYFTDEDIEVFLSQSAFPMVREKK